MYSFTINVRKRHLALAMALLLIGVWVTQTPSAGAGTDPPGEGIARVYIAVGTNYPDALGVGPGAAANGAPIILVPTNPPLDSATSAELIRLDPREVVIIGGTSAVSQNTEDALAALLPNAVFDRIGGANRYATNAIFSEQTFPIEGWVTLSHRGIFNDTAYFYGDLQLPQGAEILEVHADVYDGISSYHLELELRRTDGLILASAATGDAFNGGETTLADTTISSDNIVDNSQYGYYFEAYGQFPTGEIAILDALGVALVKVKYRLGVSG